MWLPWLRLVLRLSGLRQEGRCCCWLVILRAKARSGCELLPALAAQQQGGAAEAALWLTISGPTADSVTLAVQVIEGEQVGRHVQVAHTAGRIMALRPSPPCAVLQEWTPVGAGAAFAHGTGLICFKGSQLGRQNV
eukprot:scaffold13214_cov19-Tisochrysis_lutea.AAC.2